jgi:hypothetical protein
LGLSLLIDTKVYRGWEDTRTSRTQCRRREASHLDRSRNRTRPPTLAQGRQRQENTLQEEAISTQQSAKAKAPARVPVPPKSRKSKKKTLPLWLIAKYSKPNGPRPVLALPCRPPFYFSGANSNAISNISLPILKMRRKDKHGMSCPVAGGCRLAPGTRIARNH